MSTDLHENSSSVQAHLAIVQAVIQRMAANSTSSKTWCITLVSAILVVIADKGKPEYALLSLIPTVLFFALDSYYLSLEKSFRDSYNQFVKKLHKEQLQVDDLFVVKPSRGNGADLFLASIFSFSVWPFYLTLVVMILVAKNLVL